MRPTVLLALVLVAAGCGQQTVEGPRPEPRAAGPQQAQLGWRETYPNRTRDRVVFEVQSFEVTPSGWAARIAVTNETSVPFAVRPTAAASRYGLMLFATGDLRELEEAGSGGRLPLVRPTDDIAPQPPRVLAPGATWRARIGARGSLPAESYVRVVFGPLVAADDPPEGMEDEVVWITDRSYRLRP